MVAAMHVSEGKNVGRQWPLGSQAMWDVVRHLYALGAGVEELEAALRRSFPGFEPETFYVNVVAIELMRLEAHPELQEKLTPAEVHVAAPVEESLEQRRRGALTLIGTLMARACFVIRLGEKIKVEYRGEGTPEKLPPEVKARIAQYADELWELVGSVGS